MITLRFKDIIDQYDRKKDNELEKIPIIGKQIAERLREHEPFRYTKFPEMFENCRTDSQLDECASLYNRWIKQVGLCDE